MWHSLLNYQKHAPVAVKHVNASIPPKTCRVEKWWSFGESKYVCPTPRSHVTYSRMVLRRIVQDTRPLPPQAATEEEDAKLFKNEPYILAPVCADYGFNVSLGEGAFLNFNALFLDTCKITIGARTLVGPNVSFFAATHPLDPVVRQGLKGPEGGKPITIGEDCWIGGNVTILPGVTIGRGATIGAGSVVSKNVPAFHVAAGNPAKVIRKIETAMDPEQSGSDWKGWPEDHTEGAENPMSKME